MKLDSVKRILVEDFPSKYRDLLDPLLGIVNNFMENVTVLLTKNISFEDNILCQVKEIDVTAPIAPSTPYTFRNEIGNRVGAFQCRGIIVKNVLNLTDNTPLTGAPFISFANTQQSQIRIDNITGLTSGKKYRITIICLP